MKHWLVGVAINVIGSLMVNFGTNMMKSSHNNNSNNDKEKANDDSSDYENSRTSRSSINTVNSNVTTDALLEAKKTLPKKEWNHSWKIGVTFFMTGSLLNFVSFAFAAQSLLAALGGIQFVSNVFFASCILKEKASNKTMLATLIILMGMTITICYSNHNTSSYTSTQLLALYDRTYFIFLIVIGIILVLSEVVYWIYTQREIASRPLPFNAIVRPFCYSLVSATIGTQSVLQSKCLAELLKRSIIDKETVANNQFVEWYLYFVFTLFLTGLSFWLYRLNAALKLFDGLIIIPVLQVCWTTSAIVQGGIYFKDFQGFTNAQAIGFSTGIAIVFVGVYILTVGAKTDNNDDENNSKNKNSLGNNRSSIRKDATAVNLEYIEMTIVKDLEEEKEQLLS